MDNEKLLKTIGYQEMILTLTPEDTKEAEQLLAPMLKDFKGVNVKYIHIISYLLGIQQGQHNILSDDAAQTIKDGFARVYKMGRDHGLRTSLLMFPPNSK